MSAVGGDHRLKTCTAATSDASVVAQETVWADQLEEMLSEATVHEAVDKRVGAGVAVAKELKKGKGDPECACRVVKQQVDLGSEERKPVDNEESHNDDEHAHDTFFLALASVGVVPVRSLADWLTSPERARDAAIRHHHRHYRAEVQHDVDNQRVQHVLPSGLVVLHTDGGDVKVLHVVEVGEDLFSSHDEDLWNHQDEGRHPEDHKKDGCVGTC